MKTHNKSILPALSLAVAIFLPPSLLYAQTLIALHSFTNNPDGANPIGSVVLSGNTLYGTTQNGGNGGGTGGTVFKINTDGSGYAVLKNLTTSDGQSPYATLVLNGGVLYGTTYYQGNANYGTVFSMQTNGSGYTVLHHFVETNANDGKYPQAGLALNGNMLYGTTINGGTNGVGTVFSINTNGSSYLILKHLATTNGYGPMSVLVLNGSTIYGTTPNGGSGNSGTVFKINTDGSGYTVLRYFTNSSPQGSQPNAGLVLSGSTLFGTTYYGGSLDNGTIYKIDTNGTGFTSLKIFTNNPDGAHPAAPLLLNGNILYGTTQNGGGSGNGTVFQINTDGSGYAVLNSFALTNGQAPSQGVVLSGNTLYGTTYAGGSSSGGTVFSLSLSNLVKSVGPILNIAAVNNQSVLFWSAAVTNYVLQSQTNMSSTNWITVTDAIPVNAFTVSNTSPTRFFRLQSQ